MAPSQKPERWLIRMLGTLTALVLASCGPSEKQAFSCYKSGSQFPYGCQLNEGFKLLDVSIGEAHQQAFKSICVSKKDSTWAVQLPPGGASRFSPRKQGLRCEDWATFSNSPEWLLRSNGAPCIGDQILIIRNAQAKITELAVQCEKLSADVGPAIDITH